MSQSESDVPVDSADFPCRDPGISSPRSFYGRNICSVLMAVGSFFSLQPRLPKTAQNFISVL